MNEKIGSGRIQNTSGKIIVNITLSDEMKERVKMLEMARKATKVYDLVAGFNSFGMSFDPGKVGNLREFMNKLNDEQKNILWQYIHHGFIRLHAFIDNYKDMTNHKFIQSSKFYGHSPEFKFSGNIEGKHDTWATVHVDLGFNATHYLQIGRTFSDEDVLYLYS